MENIFTKMRHTLCSAMGCPAAGTVQNAGPCDNTHIVELDVFTGMRIAIQRGDCIGDYIEKFGFWEKELSDQFIDMGKTGGLMVDVGANIGYFSLLWARANSNNRVFAFEASPRIYPILFQNVNINGLDSQISPFCVALSNTIEIHEFILGPKEQTGWGGLMKSPDGPSVKVPCVRLDHLMPNEKIRLLKIDVEGADTWVLKGCEQLLRNHLIEDIFYEQNKPRLRTIGLDEDDAQQFLVDMGYTVTNITPVDQEVVEWHAYLT